MALARSRSMFMTLPAWVPTLPVPGTRAWAAMAHIAANAIWAGSMVATRPLLETLPPVTLAAMRVAIALVVLRLVLGVRRERAATGPGIALLGFVGVAFFCVTQNAGLLLADATTASLLAGMIPIFTVCLAIPLLGERFNAMRFTGIIVSLAGIAWIVVPDAGQSIGLALGASVLPLASAFGSALSVVLGRRAFTNGSALAVVTGSTFYGLLFLLPGAAIEIATIGVAMPGPAQLLALLYLGAGCSALAFVLRGYGLTHLEASQGAVFGNLRPVIGVALAVVLLGEPLSGAQVAGGVLVLAGVTIAGRQRPRGIFLRPRTVPDSALALASRPASPSSP